MRKTFFAAGIFILAGSKGEELLLTVKHHKGEVYKLPGGTSEKQGGRDFYIPDSKNSVLEKIRETLSKVFGRKVIDLHEKEVNEILLSLTTTNVGQYALQMVVELIEETGLIPIKFELFEHKVVSPEHDQYFYVIEEVMTWSSFEGHFVPIKEGDNVEFLPKRGIDFHCVDFDIEDTALLPLGDSTAKYNFARSHISVVDGFVINREKSQKTSQDDLLASYGY
ncbi:MAG: hypothetical protein PHC89_02425 [Candidatus Pacebacteria bacterium]|nr:hypothetical protein [Candidatus Paceibacterota bacterium]